MAPPRSPPLLVAVVALGMLALVLVVLATSARADVSPMVDPPTTDGPHQVGFYYDDVPTSTKGYLTPVLVYYPAFDPGEWAEPDPGSGPYPAVIWMPFFGGDRLAMMDVTTRLSSWGFVVMAVSVNWGDFPNSGDPDDVEDLLDYLEACDANSSSPLRGMVDTAHYGLGGYSSGGGLALYSGAYVGRVSAVQTFAAAIGASSVDAIASRYSGKAIVVQVGADDSDYIAGSRRVYQRFTCPRSLLEITGAGHGGPFVLEELVAFFLYHLRGVCGILEWVYGGKAVEGVVNDRYMLYFTIPHGDFFPPALTSSASTPSVPMDAFMDFNGTVSGFFYAAGHTGCAFEWDFDGDGLADASDPTSMLVTHAYDRPGTFSVDLWYRLGTRRASAPGGLTVTVDNVAPVARLAGSSTAYQDSIVVFDASGSTDSPSDMAGLSYRWDFGDGGPTIMTPIPEAAHTYTVRDAFTVTLTVTDPHGAEGTATLGLVVANVAPTAEAGPDLAAAEDAVLRLTGTGDDTPSDVATLWFRWDFGDGVTSDWSLTGSADHVYTRVGEHVATLTVKDSAGAVARDRLNVSVSNVAPACVIASPVHRSEFDQDAPVTFEGELADTVSDEPDLRCRWDFGDGTDTGWSSALEASTTHAFTAPGTYSVRLSVIDDDGATAASTMDVVVVNVAPTATVTRPGAGVNASEDAVLVLEGAGADTPSDADGLDIAWVVDGVRMPGARVEVSFATAGAHEARLVVTDPHGATAEAVVEVTVRNVAPDVDAAVSPPVLLEGQAVNFSCTPYDTPSDEAGLVVLWEFGDGGNTTDAEGRHVFAAAGNYTVRVTVTDDDGQTASRTFGVRVEAPPPPPPPPPPPHVVDPMPKHTILWISGAAVAALVGIVIPLFMIVRARRGRGGAPRQGEDSSDRSDP